MTNVRVAVDSRYNEAQGKPKGILNIQIFIITGEKVRMGVAGKWIQLRYNSIYLFTIFIDISAFVIHESLL